MLYCCYNVVLSTLSCIYHSLSAAFALSLRYCVGLLLLLGCYNIVVALLPLFATINPFMFVSGTIMLYCCYNVVLPTLSCIDYSLSTAFASSLLCLLTSVSHGFAIAAWLLQCCRSLRVALLQLHSGGATVPVGHVFNGPLFSYEG